MKTTWVVGILLATSLSGCTIELGQRRPGSELTELNDHILLLHNITYEWNEEDKQLSGHFILSNLYPDPNNNDKEVWVRVLLFDGRFYQDAVNRAPERNTWILGYDAYQKVTIKPGESMVFNYTFPEQSQFRNNSINWTPDEINLNMQGRYTYRDESNIRNDNPEGFVDVNHDFQNFCLHIVDAEVVQDTEGACSPWREYWERQPGWYYHIGDDYFFPPPEAWPTWSDDSPIPLSTYPQFREHVGFLQGFDLETANIVYFEGEIR